MTKRFMKRTEAYEQAHEYLNNKRKKKIIVKQGTKSNCN
jgi:hypothetical protein